MLGRAAMDANTNFAKGGLLTSVLSVSTVCYLSFGSCVLDLHRLHPDRVHQTVPHCLPGEDIKDGMLILTRVHCSCLLPRTH